MTTFWDVIPIQPKCVVCQADAIVEVIGPDATNYGPHCGIHADERVNVENFPLRVEQNPQWTDPVYDEST